MTDQFGKRLAAARTRAAAHKQREEVEKGQDRITIIGPRADGSYVIEFRTAAGETLARQNRDFDVKLIPLGEVPSQILRVRTPKTPPAVTLSCGVLLLAYRRFGLPRSSSISRMLR